LKLYGQPAALERSLARNLGPACLDLVKADVAELWFALVHADPDTHLRLRLRGDAKRLLSEGLECLRAAVDIPLADGRIRRIAIDTYEREIERYGGPEGLSAAELVFEADTEMLVRVLTEAGMDVERRYWLALTGISWLFEALLGRDPAAWSRQLRERREALLSHFRFDAGAPALFAGQRRSDASVAEQWLAGVPLSTGEAAAVEAWRMATAAPLARLGSLDEEGSLGGSLRFVAFSLGHLHAQRLLAPADRPHGEAQLLDALVRVADRRSARARVRHRVIGKEA
jgi:thiopeptide-type bacteriocin biosynthesis protein